MSAPLNSAFASVLRSGREEFNALFLAARRVHPDLDPGVFAEFLRTAVNDLVQAVDAAAPERVPEVVMAAYEASLELVAHQLVGRGARHPFIEQGWRRILPLAAPLVAAAPGQVLGAVCNALVQIAATPGARPEQWIALLEDLAPRCSDAQALLKLGQVAAWRAGLAHFRAGAIDAADGLPEPLALAALGAPTSDLWPEVRNRLRLDPWFDPGTKADGAGSVEVVARVGTFRGFGGLFTEPPCVAWDGNHFLVRSGEGCWLLTADVFGATFYRMPVGEFEAARKRSTLPPGLRVVGSGIEIKGSHFSLPALGEFTSAAANGNTLALTSGLTHAIVLVALS